MESDSIQNYSLNLQKDNIIRSGIVLYICSNTKKITILCSEEGKLELFFHERKILYNGLLISFLIEKRNLIIKEILPIHFKFDNEFLNFYHLTLELCKNFLPVGFNSKEIFNLLNFLYFFCSLFKESNFNQKLLLYKLFQHLNLTFFEEKSEILKKIYVIPIDRMVKGEIDLKIERELDDWIKKCLDLNPDIFKLKSSLFFKEVGIL